MALNVSKLWERWHPSALGLAVTLALWTWGSPLAAHAVRKAWNLPELYAAVFNLAGIYTAFLFTFYSFIATTDRGFIGRARESRYYRLTVSFTVSALILGGLLCLGTVPLLLVEPGLTTHWGRVTVAGWVGLTVWATAAFVRAAYLFTIFARSQNA